MGAAHAANYASLGSRVRVKTVLSLGSERSRKLAASLGARLVEDLDEAVSDPEVDAVDVCLPTYLHREAAEKAFASGRHVFLEKPIALSPEDADAILAAADRSKRVLMVGLVLRFWPEYAELHRLVAVGELGRPLAVSTYRLSPPADWNQWMGDESFSGGVAVDVLVHDLDQMNWLLGRALTVFARRPSPGHVMAILEYESGACGLAEASLAMPGSYPFSSNIRVLCDNGVAEYAFAAMPAEEGGNIGRSQSERGLRLYPSGGEARTVPVEAADPWGPEIAYFVECLEQGCMPEQGSGEQARAGLLVSLAVNRSLASGLVEAV
jgi:predicted dehydrogenase